MNIKYRGKQKDSGEWVHGYYVAADNKHFIIVTDAKLQAAGYVENVRDMDGGFSQEGRFWVCEAIPETVGLSAGVTDKNGKEAYRDDIVRYGKIVGVIKFEIYENPMDDNKGGHLGFYVFFKKEEFYRKDIMYWLGRCEIVGNIHEHPDIIK